MVSNGYDSLPNSLAYIELSYLGDMLHTLRNSHVAIVVSSRSLRRCRWGKCALRYAAQTSKPG